MTDDGLDVSRREALAALGTVGAASAGAGLGTTTLLGDRERFGNDRLAAGTLDLRVGLVERYANWSADGAAGPPVSLPAGGTTDRRAVGLPTQTAVGDSPLVALANATAAGAFLDRTAGERPDPGDGTADRVPAGFDPVAARGLDEPCDADLLAAGVDRPAIRLSDVEPGDFGLVTVSFALCDAPGYVRAVGRLTDATEGGLTEPEATAPAEGDGVELLDAVRTALWIDDGDGLQDADESLVFAGRLRETLAALADGTGPGLLLPGDRPARAAGGRGGRCFAAETVHALTLAWWLPTDATNAVQTDAVAFDLGLYAEQCRHNAAEGGAGVSPVRLRAGAPVGGAFFGSAVALDGDRLVVAADGEGPGALYVFDRADGWRRTARLAPADGADDLLGESVALDGDRIVAGATGDDGGGRNAGAAHVLDRRTEGWRRTARLTAPTPGPGDSFGQAVAVAGDRILVGADGVGANGPESGVAYVFERETAGWRRTATLAPADGAAGDYFGSRLVLADGGETAVIGAYGAAGDAGAAYVFERGPAGWRERARLAAPAPTPGDRLGAALAVDDRTILVGVPGTDDTYAGAAYAFPRPVTAGDAPAPTRLAPPEPTPGAFFGWAVALAGGAAVVGAYGTDAAGARSGAAYRFARDDGAWTRRGRLDPPGRAAGDRFGVTADADPGTGRLAVAADGDATPAGVPEAGAVYVFGPGGGR